MGNKLTIDATGQELEYKSIKPYFGWVEKITDDSKIRRIAGDLATCKDFLHETLEASLRPKASLKIDSETTRIAIVFNLLVPMEDLNKSVIAIKKVVNVIEAENGWKKSLISSVNLNDGTSDAGKSKRAFLFTADKRYMLNMPALHGVLFMLRSLYTIAHNLKEGTPTELANFIDKLQKEHDKVKGKKSEALTALENAGDFYYMEGIKKALEVYLSTLMREHDNLFEGLSLKDFYSRKNEDLNRTVSYHGGFGLDALHTRNLYNKIFSERCNKLFK